MNKSEKEICKKVGTRWNGSGEYHYYGYTIWKHGDGHWEISEGVSGIDGNAVGLIFPKMRDAKAWLDNTHHLIEVA